MIRRAALVALAIGMAGCAEGIEEAGGVPARLSETTVVLHEHELTLHLYAGLHAAGPLLLYATGDAGWFGSDEEIFNRLTPFEYPVAGFSARDYVHHLGHDNVVPPDDVAIDYGEMIDTAVRALHLPEGTRTILVGKSRGAGLQLAAAMDARLRSRLMGMLAIGLTREEEYVHVRVDGGTADESWAMLQTYDVLPDMAELPIAVIQSTHDQYVTAHDARDLFGPDTIDRRLTPIESANHNFGGAVPVLYQEMRRSLEWLMAPRRDRRPTGSTGLGPSGWWVRGSRSARPGIPPASAGADR